MSGTLNIGNLWSTITEAIAPSLLSLQDIKTSLLGTPCQLLRIHLEAVKDIDGEQEATYTSGVISNAIIKYPMGEVELFDYTSDANADSSAFSLSEIMPITLYTHFSGVNSADITNVEKEDIIIDVKKNEHGLPLPIILKVNYIAYGSFMGQRLVTKRYELSIVRGPLQDNIQAVVNSYIASIT